MTNTIPTWRAPPSYGVYSLAGLFKAGNSLGENPENKPIVTSIAASTMCKLRSFYPQGFEEPLEVIEEKEVSSMPTTVMHDDGFSVANEFSNMAGMDLLKSIDVTIPDFLAKPQNLGTLIWNPTGHAGVQPQGTPLMTYDVQNYFAQDGAFPVDVWTDKIQGFSMFRGVAVFRVVINANPFQQGKLLISFLPNLRQYLGVDTIYAGLHYFGGTGTTGQAYNLTAMTQAPNIELDCSQTTAILKIPFIAPTNYCKRRISDPDFYDWGTFFITVLAELRTGDTQTVDITAYLSFEEFELVAPIIPQAGGGGSSSKKYAVSVTGREEEIVSSGGSLTAALKTASSVASSLSSIPVIGAIAGEVSWAARVASGISSVFGWSKPLVLDTAQHVNRSMVRYSATSDGGDNSFPLAMIADNKVSITDINSIRAEDEMSFSFLKRVSALTDTTFWNTTGTNSAPGDNILSYNIGPFLGTGVSQTVAGHVSTWMNFPPFAYFANFFMYWRGSIEIRFKLVKTIYHTGRLQVTISPTGGSTTATPNNLNSTFSLREIIDIRAGNEFTIVVPWYIASNYLLTSQGSAQLDLTIINSLRAPATCSQQVDILVYACGGKDFELAGPGLSGNGGQYLQPFSPQSGDGVAPGTAAVITHELCGGQGTDAYSSVHSVHSMGELFTSVRQLLNRANPIHLFTGQAPVSASIGVYPWFWGYSSMDPTTGLLSTPDFGGTMYDIVAPLYAFYKGSMRIQWAYPSLNTHGNTAVTSVDPAYASYGGSIPLFGDVPTNTSYNAGNYGTLRQPTLSKGTHVTDTNIGTASYKVPYYCRTKVSMNVPQQTFHNNAELSQPTTLLTTTFSEPWVDGQQWMCLRSIGEDFSFSYFIGCPPLLLSYA